MLSPSEFISNAFTQLDTYIVNVLSSGVTTNRYERLAVDRFLKLKNQYYYNESGVRRVFKFLSLINIPINNEVQQYQIQGHEAFWIANIYGLWKDETTRLFDLSYISIAKGNNKSTIAAILSIYEAIGKGTINAHILMVARSREQSRTLIEYTDKIIKNSPAITPLFKVNKNLIYNQTENSKNRIEIRASDSSTIHGIGAGMTLSVIDEYAVHKDSNLQQIIKSAQESKQKNHHQLIITHASNDKFNSPAYPLQETCQNILEGKVIADNIFTQIFTLDDKTEIDNPECWRKSNPSLGVCVPKENLLTSYNTAKLFRDKYDTFLTYNLNYWSDNLNNNWIDDDLIKFLMKDNRTIAPGSKVYVGLDLSANSDLCSIGLVHYDELNDKYTTKTINIFPNNEKKRIRQGSIDLSKWFKKDDDVLYIGAETGYIIQNKGKVLDENLVVSIIEALNDRYEIVSVGADPWNSTLLLEKIERELGIETYKVRQNIATLSYPLRVFETLILQEKLFFEQNPVLRWMFSNVAIYSDANHNKKIDKRGREAVDGVVSLVIAVHEYLRLNESSTSHFLEELKALYSKNKAA